MCIAEAAATGVYACIAHTRRRRPKCKRGCEAATRGRSCTCRRCSHSAGSPRGTTNTCCTNTNPSTFPVLRLAYQLQLQLQTLQPHSAGSPRGTIKWRPSPTTERNPGAGRRMPDVSGLHEGLFAREGERQRRVQGHHVLISFFHTPPNIK